MNARARITLLATALVVTACDDPSNPLGEKNALVSAAECAAAKPWTEWTPYATGALVTYAGGTYRCVQSHTSQPGWTPSAVPALWSVVSCAGGADAGVGGGSSGSDAGSAGSTGGNAGGNGGSTSGCNAGAWVGMANDPNACSGHLGESCGWTATNLRQGYHCQTASWGAACVPGGTTCPTGSGGGSTGGSSGGTTDAGTGGSTGGTPDAGTGGSTGGTAGTVPAGLVFSPYKDTSVHMNWNTNVASTTVSGSSQPFASDAKAHGVSTVTLAFATGECGSENWGGVAGAAMASANVPLLDAAGVDFVLSTGGAAGSFTCGSDQGFATFLMRWSSSHLVGVDFDIEAGQSASQIADLLRRMKTAHATHPGMRFSLTVATLANNAGANKAQSLGAGVAEGLNAHGVDTLNAVKSVLGWTGTAATWPSYVTVNLMVMDYGSPGASVCVVANGVCDMGESALQAAYNLRDRWGVPFTNIELTPMIGGNDVQGELFTLADVDTVTRFANAQKLAGVHFWSYDRDVDCPAGYASPTCNSLGGIGAYGFLRRFLADGLR